MGYLGEEFPKLGFGLMRLPKLEDGTDDVEQVKQMVDAFIAGGGRYFDTARAYGSSEATIKQALVDRYPRESYILATKNNAWNGCETKEDAQQRFYTSLETTGAGYFDFYLIHNVGNTRTACFDEFEVWDFVKQLKEEGLVKHIGFSFHDTADVLEQVIEAHPEMEFVQLQINYVDWDYEAVQSRACYEVARKHGLPVVIMEPLRGGMLANPPAAAQELFDAADPARGAIGWALGYVWSLEGVITVLSGMSALEQMEQNLVTWKAFEKFGEKDYETMAQVQQVMKDAMAVPCTSCRYCVKDCPQNINIPGCFDAVNRAALGGVENMRPHWSFMNMGSGDPASCIECGQCEAACPQHIKVIQELKNGVAMFA